MKLLVVGGSAAGMSAALQYHRLKPSDQVTVICDEGSFYARCRIPEVLGGEAASGEISYPASLPADGRLKVLHGRAVSIDPDNRTVLLDGGSLLPCDKLLVAAGASPVRLGVEGEGLKGVLTLRSLGDALSAAEAARSARSGVVCGGGLVGLKGALALKKLVPNVTVLVGSPGLLSRQLDETGSAMLERELKGIGINVVFNTRVERFLPSGGGGTLGGLLENNGGEMEAGVVIVGKGVRPNVDLVNKAGGAVGAGIKVNRQLQTSLPGIYAAGDCIEVEDFITGRPTPSGLWPLAVEQGRYAAYNMAGISRPYPRPITRMNSAQFGDLPIISVGARDGEEEYASITRQGRAYRRLVFTGGRLVGFILLGDVGKAGIYTALIKSRRTVPSALRQRLLEGSVCAHDISSGFEFTGEEEDNEIQGYCS